ncbi:MAG: ABC transporter substrate-binding protein [Pseudomonadota bacterium]|nr:ABC transporter substrate-binding protein [Pseudomonadota bacterium]
MVAVLRSAFLVAFLALTVAGPAAAFAQDGEAGAAPSAPAAQTHDEALKTPAGKFVQDLGDRAIAIIADKNVNPAQRNEKFQTILSDSFDLMTIGRFVIGRSWNTATPDQQKEYMKLFQALVVKSYGDRLTLYTGEGFQVTAARPESDKDFIVASQITHPDGSQPTVIDWRVRQRNGKLGVIDVVVEGVSLSVTQRQEYSAVIQQHGGQIDGLLAVMRKQLETPEPASNAG